MRANRATTPRHVGGRDRCAACHLDPERLAQLNSELVARISQRKLARRYQISRSSIQRHLKAHMPASLVRLDAAPFMSSGNGSMASSEDVVAEAKRLYEDCRSALDSALRGGNPLSLSLAAREVHRALDLLGRQLDRIEQRRGNVVPVIDFFKSEDWQTVMGIWIEVATRHDREHGHVTRADMVRLQFAEALHAAQAKEHHDA